MLVVLVLVLLLLLLLLLLLRATVFGGPMERTERTAEKEAAIQAVKDHNKAIKKEMKKLEQKWSKLVGERHDRERGLWVWRFFFACVFCLCVCVCVCVYICV